MFWCGEGGGTCLLCFYDLQRGALFIGSFFSSLCRPSVCVCVTIVSERECVRVLLFIISLIPRVFGSFLSSNAQKERQCLKLEPLGTATRFFLRRRRRHLSPFSRLHVIYFPLHVIRVHGWYDDYLHYISKWFTPETSPNNPRCPRNSHFSSFFFSWNKRKKREEEENFKLVAPPVTEISWNFIFEAGESWKSFSSLSGWMSGRDGCGADANAIKNALFPFHPDSNKNKRRHIVKKKKKKLKGTRRRRRRELAVVTFSISSFRDASRARWTVGQQWRPQGPLCCVGLVDFEGG